MFWKILQWVQIVISLIREAEDELGFGRGLEKRALVVQGATRELEGLATRAQVGRCDAAVFASYAGQVVDGVVGLMNCFGALPRSTAPPAIASAASSGSSSSSSADTPAPGPEA